MRIKVGDTVKVIAGDDKGATGKVIRVIRDKNRVVACTVRLISHPSSSEPGYWAEPVERANRLPSYLGNPVITTDVRQLME